MQRFHAIHVQGVNQLLKAEPSFPFNTRQKRWNFVPGFIILQNHIFLFFCDCILGVKIAGQQSGISSGIVYDTFPMRDVWLSVDTTSFFPPRNEHIYHLYYCAKTVFIASVNPLQLITQRVQINQNCKIYWSEKSLGPWHHLYQVVEYWKFTDWKLLFYYWFALNACLL